MPTLAHLAERPLNNSAPHYAARRCYVISPPDAVHLKQEHFFFGRKAFGQSVRWRCVAFAQAGPGSADNTIKSLESILGSNDSLDEGDKHVQAQDGSSSAGRSRGGARKGRQTAPDAGEKRVRPLYVYVIYYCFIVVYLAAAWLQATEGDLAASTLIDGLVNDHLAVASGQVPRLATAGFVCEGPLALFMQLATLLTVGAEAEAVLGYSLFWAVYWMANLGGGLADAALSELPVTFGPANAAAGIVGALLAYYARNLGLDERIAAARKAVQQRRRQVLDGVATEVGDGRPLVGTSSGRDTVEEAEAEVEVLPLLSLKFKARLGTEARGLLNVLVALVVAGQGLLEFGGANSSASWIGLIAAFWTGLILTFGAGPEYDVKYTLSAVPTDNSCDSDERLPMQSSVTSTPQPEGGPASEAARTPSNAEEADADGLMVVDVCPLPRRQAVLGGYVACLGVVICCWLAWMGTDI